MMRKKNNILKKTASVLLALMLLSSLCACEDDSETSDTDASTTSAVISIDTSSDEDSENRETDSTLSEDLTDEQLFVNYYEKDLTEKYGKPDSDSQAEDYKTCAGLAGKLIYDFDGDKHPEMLVARSLGEKNTEFALEIYEIENGKVKLQAVIKDGEKTYDNKFASNDIFFVLNGDEPLICSKLYTSDDISAFAYKQTFYIYKYYHDGPSIEYSTEYTQNEDGSLAVIQNGETICSMSANGAFDSSLDAANLNDLSQLLKSALSTYSLEDKIIEEKSLDEVALITYDGFNPNSQYETHICERIEIVEDINEPVVINISGNFDIPV